MTQEERDRHALIRLLGALGPWLGQVVLVGGWAHRLYRLHPLGQEVPYPPLGTKDADLAIPPEPPPHEETIGDRLIAAGFREELVGDARPPVARYRLGEEHGGFYAEFLTPLIGSGYKPRKGADVTATISGISAQKLRHLELLMIEPWFVTLDQSTGFSSPSALAVCIPNAASYIAQKLLIHPRRKPREKAKDLLYLHDTLETFGRSLEALRSCWTDAVVPDLPTRTRRSVVRAIDKMFGDVTDVHREAATMSPGRDLKPSVLVKACRAGLDAIFR